MRYYKGKVISQLTCFAKKYTLGFDHIGFEDKSYVLNILTSVELYRYFEHRKDDYEKINTGLREICISKGNKEELDNLFLSIVKPDINTVDGSLIYYEKLYDNNGNCYGKELLTGLLFPIKYSYDDYDISYDSNKVLFDIA